MAADQATQDRVQKRANRFQLEAEAWGRVPEGTVLPSGQPFRNGETRSYSSVDAAEKDDQWVMATYGNQTGGGTVNRNSEARAASKSELERQLTSSAPKEKTVNRNDRSRASAEEVQSLDAALAGLGPSSPLEYPDDIHDDVNTYIFNPTEEDRYKGVKAAYAEELKKQDAIEKAFRERAAARYTPQYYSGAQAQIYFGDILIDEIVQFQYTTATNKMPIYGYASELFDTVASGNLLVQGSFVINFVEAGYLAIIAAAIADRSFGRKAIGRRSYEKRNAATGEVLSETLRETSILTPGSYLGNQALNQVRGLGNKEFRALARELNVNKIGQNNKPLGEAGHTTRFDLMAPFDIYAIFGDYTDPNADHTVRKLKNVYLTGQGQTITVSGEPVGEMYNFIARTIE